MSQTENNWNQLIEKLDSAIKRGDTRIVHSELLKLNLKKIPRSYRADLAEIARRSSEIILALKILSPVIYSKQGAKLSWSSDSTFKERIVFASTLTLLGLNQEALNLMNDITYKQDPSVLLYRSFAFFGMWNYDKAVPILKKYSYLDEVPPYMRLVGQVNLIAAYIGSQKFDEAEDLIMKVLRHAKEGNHKLLIGNILELNSQLLIQQGKYEKALEILNEASKFLQPIGGLYFALVQKWQYICQLMLRPHDKDLLTKLESFQLQARQFRYWEIVRDCELYISKIQNNQRRAENAVQGTPFVSYRKRAQEILGIKFKKKEVYRRYFSESPIVMDCQESSLLKQPTLRSALYALGGDFFKPLSMGALFKALYPGEVFNPFTSPKRVMNTIYRLRKWFKKYKWPLEIEVHNLEFLLVGQGTLNLYRRKINNEEIILSKFSKANLSRSFSRKDMALFLNISQRKANQIIQYGLKSNILTLIGRGRSSRYLFENNWKVIEF